MATIDNPGQISKSKWFVVTSRLAGVFLCFDECIGDNAFIP
jgi:hypothetical protein